MPSAARDRLSAQSRFASIGAEAARALGVGESSIPVRRVEHHRAHLASSFLVSPFDQAALFSIDGLGDFASAMWGVGLSLIHIFGSPEPDSIGDRASCCAADASANLGDG